MNGLSQRGGSWCACTLRRIYEGSAIKKTRAKLVLITWRMKILLLCILLTLAAASELYQRTEHYDDQLVVKW